MSSELPGWSNWCAQQGLDKHGRPKATGGNGESSATRMFFFIFYVMLGGDPLIICLPGFSPVFQHQGTEEPTNAAFNCLQSHGLLRDGASFPSCVWELENFLQLLKCSGICLVEVDQASLVASSSFRGLKKVYSLVDRTGHSTGRKDKTVTGFGADKYEQVFQKLSSRHCSFFTPGSPPTMHQPKVSGGATALPPTGPATQIGGGGTAATSLPTVLCGHDVCSTMEHLENAGHGAIVFPWFMYHDHASGATFPVVILVYEKRAWNAICETMSRSDGGCWFSTIQRALREEGKLDLRKKLKPTDGTPMRGSLERTPVWYMQIGDLVKTKLSRATLNDSVAADNANHHLPRDFKEIQAIGFFRQLLDGSLVGLPGNPTVPSNVYSTIVTRLLADLVWALPKRK